MGTPCESCGVEHEHAGAHTLTGTHPGAPSNPRTYDPKDVKVTFNGVELTGFADGTLIEFTGRYLPNVKFTAQLHGVIHHPFDLDRWLKQVEKLAKRRVHRDRMRARKRRRGW